MTIAQLFASSLWTYLPLGIAAMFALLLLPSLQVAGARPAAVARAISCIILTAVGVALMAVGAIQLVYSLMVSVLPDFPVLGFLLILFSTGLGIVVHESRTLGRLDPASSLVPRLIFCHTLECIGILVTLGALLSLLINGLMTQEFGEWQLPATLALLGASTALITSLHLSQLRPVARPASARSTAKKK